MAKTTVFLALIGALVLTPLGGCTTPTQEGATVPCWAAFWVARCLETSRPVRLREAITAKLHPDVALRPAIDHSWLAGQGKSGCLGSCSARSSASRLRSSATGMSR
jgi:hypothetical protein